MDFLEILIFKWPYSEKLTIVGMEWKVIEHENPVQPDLFYSLMYTVLHCCRGSVIINE